MQLRYLAAAGPGVLLDRLAARLSGTRLPLAPILRAPRLAAWAVPGTPWIAAPDGSAAAIGLAHDTAHGQRQASLPHPLPPPERFVRQFWGVYVLLAGHEGDADRGHAVLRDPSGGVSAYHRRAGDLDLYASDLALLAAAVPDRPAPDMAFLRHWLVYPYLRTSRTGLAGVREILPGIARRVTPAQAAERLAWSPWDHARADRTVGDFGDAAARLRAALLHAVPRLAALAGDPVVQLSGGLDSSIVAAALAAAGRPFRAVTFATRAPDGDERLYAREVAEHCGIALAELVEEPAPAPLTDVPPLTPRPPPNALLRQLHRALAAYFATTGADLVLDGAGGDNVFCYLDSAAPALDALRRRGPRAALAAIGDIGRVHGVTAWAVARGACRRAGRRSEPWRRDDSFLAPGTAPAFARHPWLEAPAGAARGTFEHVRSIVAIHHFLPDPAPGSAAVLHPLLAQPVLEACLGVPTWLWVHGGRDRAVARAAFGELLPRAILARRAKGRLESMFVTGYRRGRGALGALLLDGKLAAAGLLDRAEIAAYLGRDEDPRDAGYIRLLELSAAESWLRAFDA